MRPRSYLVRPIKAEDLEYIADNLRNPDKAEMAAATGRKQFLSQLSVSAELAEEVKVVEADGLPLMVLGLSPLSHDTKGVWFAGTKRVTAESRSLVETTRQVMRQWFAERPKVSRVVNFTYCRNRLHHRWLEALGATIHPAEPVGTQEARFHPFSIDRSAIMTTAEA